MNKLLSKFYGSFLGGLYFEFLLWWDRLKTRRNTRFLTPKEISQVVREYSLLNEGVKDLKSKVNNLVNSTSKEAYNNTLSQIEDMLALTEKKEANTKFVKSLRQISISSGNRDIVTHTDMAKMIDKRIEDMKELQNDRAKRQLIREIRKARLTNNTDLAKQLEGEFQKKYGRSNSRPK